MITLTRCSSMPSAEIFSLPNGSIRLTLPINGTLPPHCVISRPVSQSAGSLSFRQLLLMENVFDLRSVRVSEAMRLEFRRIQITG